MFVSCDHCQECWSLCRRCRRSWTRLRNRADILRHSSRCHKNEHDVTKRSEFCFGTSDAAATNNGDLHELGCNASTSMGSSEIFENFGCDGIVSVSANEVTDAPTIYFDNDCSTRYFESERIGQGINMLVGWSQMKLNVTQADHYHDYEVAYHMDVARLVSLLPISQVELLSNIICQMVSIVKQRYAVANTCNMENSSLPMKEISPSPVKVFTTLPTTIQAMRRLYLDPKYGIIRNLPRPTVTVVGGHGYVSLKECIADMLAHGEELDIITSDSPATSVTRKMSESPRARKIYENAKIIFGASIERVLVIYFNEWSDEFEPMYSSKSNRCSTWIKTITISPPSDRIHKLSHTYTIAVGRKGSNHEVVERLLADEMKQLQSGEGNLFYSK